MNSCIYEGTVTHCRHHPVHHRFTYRLSMVYLDLDELPSIVGRGNLISDRKYSLRSYMRSDHLFDSSCSLQDELRALVRSASGIEATGPIRLLTQLRYFGYYLSPLNLYYLFDESDQELTAIVAEVNNTPWDERHCYVLWDENRIGDAESLNFEHPKAFHVSPFMGMEMHYQWALSAPGQRLQVDVGNLENNRRFFDVNMSLQRRELTSSQLRRTSLRFPWMTARIGIAIYFQALKLWWKKCPFYTHPKNLNSTSATLSDKDKESLPHSPQ